jgi:hypothetical protein
MKKKTPPGNLQNRIVAEREARTLNNRRARPESESVMQHRFPRPPRLSAAGPQRDLKQTVRDAQFVSMGGITPPSTQAPYPRGPVDKPISRRKK